MNPAVLTAFALAIVGDGQGPAYPGIPGHEPSVDDGRKPRSASTMHECNFALSRGTPART